MHEYLIILFEPCIHLTENQLHQAFKSTIRVYNGRPFGSFVVDNDVVCIWLRLCRLLEVFCRDLGCRKEIAGVVLVLPTMCERAVGDEPGGQEQQKRTPALLSWSRR